MLSLFANFINSMKSRIFQFGTLDMPNKLEILIHSKSKQTMQYELKLG